MEFRVEDHEQVDHPRSPGVKKRHCKSGMRWKVEFREESFKTANKIWLGTFKTREEANKAYDAALHVLGRPTHYYPYPPEHFRKIVELPQGEHAVKEHVKFWAKEYAKHPLSASELVLLEELERMLRAEDPSSEAEVLYLEASNEFKQIYSEFQACCEPSAHEVGAGSADAAINSANKEAAVDLTASIDPPLESVPRSAPYNRRQQLELPRRIEGMDNLDLSELADVCKSTED